MNEDIDCRTGGARFAARFSKLSKPLFYLILASLLVAWPFTCQVVCVAPEKTVKTLTDEGYTDVEPGEYCFLCCGKSDFYHTKFEATNIRGVRVSGVVCCGLFFKACTVRH